MNLIKELKGKQHIPSVIKDVFLIQR